MKTRGIAVFLAALLAIGATLAIYLYVQGVRDTSRRASEDQVTVIVSKQDIAAGTSLDSLIKSGGFTTLQVPANTLVQGAVTDLTQLKGHTTQYPVLQGQQISVAVLQGSALQVKGGRLGIPAGMEAVTFATDLPQAVGGELQAGDHVTIYASFDDVSVLTGNLQKILKGQGEEKKVDLGDMTVTVVPDVQILKVELPSTTSSLGNTGSGQTAKITFAFTPQDASNFIQANAKGSVWLALLPPNQKGESLPPTSIVSLLGSNVRRLAV
jgi:pilus assembly protein CpaB